jgi:phosphoglycolate phosphatase
MSKKSRIILFDLDGTLIDSTEAILYSFRRSHELMGTRPPADEEIKSLVGHPLGEMFEATGVEREKVESYVRAYRECYSGVHTRMTRLLPGVKEALHRAAEDARLAVVTTKTGKYSLELLEHFSIAELFETLVGSEDVSRHKPHPEPLLKALSQMGFSSEKCYMVGDRCMDMLAASAAGVEGVGVDWGYAHENELSSCASFVCKSVNEAVTLILGS